MKSWKSCLFTVAVLVGGGVAAAQQYVELPPGASIRGVSSDGSIVVGQGSGGGFYWRWRVDPAPVDIGGITAVGVSDDGTYIAGSIEDPGSGNTVAARWSLASGWVSIGGFSTCGSISGAYDISADGDKVVGLAWDGCDAVGFVWTASTDILQLQSLGMGGNRASAISADGNVIGGFAQGTFNRTPTLWDASTQNGQVFDVDDSGEILGLNGDGSVYLGTRDFGGSSSGAFVGSAGTGFVNLGSLNTGWSGNATDISEDGQVIVGFDTQLLAQEAWIWRQGSGLGIESMADYLVSLGFAPTLFLTTCVGVSDDGKVIVGNGSAPFVFSQGFIAEIEPQDSPWEDLGGGTDGINGHPTLSGTGTLVSGDPTSIDLVQGPSGAISVVWTSLVSVPFPVAGGTIHANPYASEILIPLNGSGEFHAAFPWFAGVPSGLSLHFQFIIEDLSRVYGFSLSNGLKATAP